MGSIHQLLPALNEAEQLVRKVGDETAKAFSKDEPWEGYIKGLYFLDEDRQSEAAGAGESRELSTTVLERLAREDEFKIRNYDCQLQREEANAIARADVILPDGQIVGNFPVGYLMYLEKQLARERDIFEKAPTIDARIRWEPDPDAAFEGVRKSAEPQKTNKTEKQRVVLEKAKATDKHPAQVDVFEKDVVVGYYSTVRKTGKLSAHEKHERLRRYDILLTAVRQAKAKANETEVPRAEIGARICHFLNTGSIE